jgi:ABC-2 type transport system permease protein
MSETSPAAAATAVPAKQPFQWSVRRELWEHGSLYYAPLAIAGLMLVGFVISLFSLTRHNAEIKANMTPDSMPAIMILPYDIAVISVVVVSVIVGLFYCLSALYNERRERSILFWKSLPVSNLTTVLSKAFMPMVALPVIVFAVVTVMLIAMLLLNVVGRAVAGLDVGELFANVPLFQMAIVVLYGVISLALWHAPIYAWFILVSAWAKKAPILWAVIPPVALAVVERIAFSTGYVGQLINYRLGGAFETAFSKPVILPMHSLHEHPAKVVAGHVKHGMDGVPLFGIAQIDVVHFLSTPGLWAGLIVAAAFLAVAVWLRRTREAI